MIVLHGRGIVKGRGAGQALITRKPLNFTAAHTHIKNILPGKRGVIQDRHHDLYGANVKDKVLVFPSCIGSTYTGMVLLELIFRRCSAAGFLVEHADTLLVSGPILAQEWLGQSVPVVEYRGADLFSSIRSGDHLSLDGSTGKIQIERR